MTIAYRLGNALYLNITNKCPCNCRFCIRDSQEGVNPGESLWLPHEPSLTEILDALSEINFKEYSEIVFCGYGEPTERLDVLLECARAFEGCLPVRVNTNGLSDLINGKKTAPLLAEHVNAVHISLNAPDADSYNDVCRPVFGEGSFEALIQFAKDCRECIPEVKLTVVRHTLDDESVEKCRRLCEDLDIPLRVR